MSSISGANQALYPYLQSLSANASSPTVLDPSTASATESTAAGSSGQSVQGSGHHGSSGFFKQIQEAVTNALQSAASGDSTDPNQTIADAIAQVFQNSGAASTTTTAAGHLDGDAEASGAADAETSGPQAFFQTLQSNGIDPQQFHQDFLTAIKDAQGGNVDPSTAFASFPPGTLVDTTA
jgi:hypothetical protein